MLVKDWRESGFESVWLQAETDGTRSNRAVCPSVPGRLQFFIDPGHADLKVRSRPRTRFRAGNRSVQSGHPWLRTPRRRAGVGRADGGAVGDDGSGANAFKAARPSATCSLMRSPTHRKIMSSHLGTIWRSHTSACSSSATSGPLLGVGPDGDGVTGRGSGCDHG